MARSFQRCKATLTVRIDLATGQISNIPVAVAPIPEFTEVCARCGGKLGKRRWWGKMSHRKRVLYCKKCGEIYPILDRKE